MIEDEPSASAVTIADSDALKSSESKIVAVAGAAQSPEDWPATRSLREDEFREDVSRVTAAVRDSTIRLTVAQVRVFLECSQKHAQAVRKLVADSIGRKSEVSA